MRKSLPILKRTGPTKSIGGYVSEQLESVKETFVGSTSGTGRSTLAVPASIVSTKSQGR